MHTFECPHCGKDNELIGQKELTGEYGLKPNRVIRLLERGELPKPAIRLVNRRLWVRQQIDDFKIQQRRERVQALLTDTEEALHDLPEDERRMFLEALTRKEERNLGD